MKSEILKLKKEGKSYNEIQRIVGCSKSLICYYCGNEQKLKNKIRHKKHKKTLNNNNKRKKDNFSFTNGNRKCKSKRVNHTFTAEEFKEKIINNPEFYLSGRKINLLQSKTYHCDHIIPVAKGGTCELNNMGLACKEANMAKSDLTLEEFISLCKEVLIHHGYKIEKI